MRQRRAQDLLADGCAVSVGARDPQPAAARFADAPAARLHAARFEADDPERVADTRRESTP